MSVRISLLKGIAALHRLDIVHRDIKPPTFILAQDGNCASSISRVALSLGERKADDLVDQAGTLVVHGARTACGGAAGAGLRSFTPQVLRSTTC